MEYDALGRHTSTNAPIFNEAIGYDALGNLVSVTIDGITNNYTYSHLNQLTSENEHTYRYDSIDNRIAKDNDPYRLSRLNRFWTIPKRYIVMT